MSLIRSQHAGSKHLHDIMGLAHSLWFIRLYDWLVYIQTSNNLSSCRFSSDSPLVFLGVSDYGTILGDFTRAPFAIMAPCVIKLHRRTGGVVNVGCLLFVNYHHM